ncbi:MAG: hypothetical protein JW995_08910 [Melioribacteraceae bacterium]|nr:hypothetical protein [Melioribacteraceae bacterium]
MSEVAVNNSSNRIKLVSIVKAYEEKKIFKAFDEIVKNCSKTNSQYQVQIIQPENMPNYSLIVTEVAKEDAFDIAKFLTIERIPLSTEDPLLKIAIQEGRIALEQNQVDVIHKMRKPVASGSEEQKGNKEGTLDKIIESGDWQLLLKVVMNTSVHNIDNSRKIKEKLPGVLDAILKNISDKPIEKVHMAQRNVEKLVQIALNHHLKALRFNAQMQTAGKAAISICSEYPKQFIPELIEMSNSSSTVPYVNIKAFMTLYEIFKDNIEEYKLDIQYSVKNINTRSLIAISQLSFDMTEEMRTEFNNAIDFFSEMRQLIQNE